MRAVDWTSKNSLHNWITELKLICSNKYDVAFIGSSYFLGMVISILVFPRLSDMYGRIKILYGMLAFGLISYIGILFFSTSLRILYHFYFMQGMAATIAVCVGYNYLMEFLPIA